MPRFAAFLWAILVVAAAAIRVDGRTVTPSKRALPVEFTEAMARAGDGGGDDDRSADDVPSLTSPPASVTVEAGSFGGDGSATKGLAAAEKAVQQEEMGPTEPSDDGAAINALEQLDKKVSAAEGDTIAAAPPATSSETATIQKAGPPSEQLASTTPTEEADHAKIATAEDDTNTQKAAGGAEEALDAADEQVAQYAMREWAATFGAAVHENFAKHEISNAYLFAKNVQEKLKGRITDKVSASNLSTLAFIAGLYHDSAYPEVAQRRGYKLTCDPSDMEVENDHGSQLGLIQDGYHPSSSKGHEEYGICNLMKFFHRVQKIENPKRVEKRIQNLITPQHVHFLVAAIMHTKMGFVTGKGHPLQVPYVESEVILHDIQALMEGKNVLSDHPATDPFVCDVFPLKDWVKPKKYGSYWAKVMDNGDESAQMAGKYEINTLFYNSNIAEYGQRRGMCVAMSRLHEIMTYEGLATQNPYIAPVYELVLRHLFGKSEKEIVALRAETLAKTSQGGDSKPWITYGDYTVIVIAYLHDQIEYMQNWVNFKKFRGDENEDSDAGNRDIAHDMERKEDNVDGLRAARDKLISRVFPTITKAQISAWDSIRKSDPLPEKCNSGSISEQKVCINEHNTDQRIAQLKKASDFEKNMSSFRVKSPDLGCDKSPLGDGCDVGPRPLTRDFVVSVFTDLWDPKSEGLDVVYGPGPECSYQKVPFVLVPAKDGTMQLSSWSGRFSQNPLVLPPEVSPLSEDATACKAAANTGQLPVIKAK